MKMTADKTDTSGMESQVMSDQYLYCWQWTWGIGKDFSGTDYEGQYPKITEEYDSHEAIIVFWEAPE